MGKPDDNDWRLQGQERYLKGAQLTFRKYRPPPQQPEWDHDHCEFCFATFMLGHAETLDEGYCTLDEYRWICPRCFDDFHIAFEWQIVKADDRAR